MEKKVVSVVSGGQHEDKALISKRGTLVVRHLSVKDAKALNNIKYGALSEDRTDCSNDLRNQLIKQSEVSYKHSAKTIKIGWHWEI